MPPETPRTARWKIVTGYAVFGVLMFILSLYVTFPFDVVKQRVVSEANNAGWSVTMGSLGPGLLGVTASNVRLSKVPDPNAPRPPEGAPEQPEPEPLVIPEVSARPTLFPPGLAVRARAFGGNISLSVGGLSDLSINATLDNLDPSKGNLKAFSGLDLEGKLNGELSLVVPRTEVMPGGKVKDYDLGAANGSLSLSGEKLVIKGGTVTVPMYGQPTPMDLPRIALGDLDGKVKIDKGLATLDQFRGRSDDLELAAMGTVKLNRRPEFSELNLDLKLKAEKDFIKRLGMIGSALSILPADKDNPAFRALKVTGYIGRPSVPGLMMR